MKRKLVIVETSIDQTAKDSKMFRVFKEPSNLNFERNRIQKENCEDEGVIVGRSLDMFIPM